MFTCIPCCGACGQRVLRGGPQNGSDIVARIQGLSSAGMFVVGPMRLQTGRSLLKEPSERRAHYDSQAISLRLELLLGFGVGVRRGRLRTGRRCPPRGFEPGHRRIASGSRDRLGVSPHGSVLPRGWWRRLGGRGRCVRPDRASPQERRRRAARSGVLAGQGRQAERLRARARSRRRGQERRGQ